MWRRVREMLDTGWEAEREILFSELIDCVHYHPHLSPALCHSSDLTAFWAGGGRAGARLETQSERSPVRMPPLCRRIMNEAKNRKLASVKERRPRKEQTGRRHVTVRCFFHAPMRAKGYFMSYQKCVVSEYHPR
jgi:hypothetical protein